MKLDESKIDEVSKILLCTSFVLSAQSYTSRKDAATQFFIQFFFHLKETGFKMAFDIFQLFNKLMQS